MTRSRLPQMPRVREKTARAGLARRKANRRHQAAFEVLEQRLEMAQVSWTGLGDGTTWQDLNNWSTKAVPGGSDDVTINVANNPTITYNGTSTIHSLVDNDSLNIASGSLSITSGASQVVGSLNVASGATLSLSGSGASFTASGATTIDGANLYASGGAVLAFPNLTSYAAQSVYYPTIQANGTGSVVDLSHLTTLSGDTNTFLSVNAQVGGKVNLSNLTSYTGGATFFTADGAASTIDLTNLTKLAADYYKNVLQATNGGTILDPLLTTLDHTDLTTDATSKLATAQITAFTSGTITANGGTPDYSGLTSLDGDSVSANNGAVLAFPGVTSYAAQSASYNPTIQANGTGSVVDLSHLTTLAGGTYPYLSVNALAGGKVNLGNLNNYTTGATLFTASGAASTIDLSKLTRLFSDTYYNSGLQATNGGIILDPILTTLDHTDLTTDGTGTLATAQITTFTNGIATVSGGAADFSGMIDVTGSSFTLSGGGTANLDNASKIDQASFFVSGGVTLALPAATSYSAQNYSTIQASGTGSVIDLSHLTALAGTPYWPLSVNALAGGKVDLSNLATYTGGVTRFTADGAANGTASTIDLSKLTKLFSDSYYNSWLQATNGGTIVLNSGTVNLTGVDVSAASTGTIVGGALQLFRGALSGSATLSGDSTIQASVFNSGATSPGVNGAGTLTIHGNFTQTSAGSLNIDIGGTTAGTQYDQLAVTGSAALDGTLNLSQINGFAASNGNQFTIVTAASLTGLFSTVNGQDAGNGQFFSPVFNPTNVTLLAADSSSLRVTSQVPSRFATQAITSLTLNFTEALVGSDASNPANYTLVGYGINGVPGSGGTPITVTPSYTDGSTQVVLTFPALADGTYQLTLQSGNTGIHGVDGRLLDGINNGVGGTNYVATFAVDTSAPTVSGATIQAGQIQVTYSDPEGLDLASVTNLANYQLLASGGDGIFGNGNDVDVSSDIANITYDTTTEIATLHFINPLPDEVYQLTINGHSGVTDPAGNKLQGGTDYVQVLPLNSIPPMVNLVLDAASDTGASHTDGLTNVTTPTFDVTVNRSGSIELDVDGTAVKTQPVAAAGIVPIALTSALADGQHAIKTIFTPSTGTAVQASITVTIDTTHPTVVAGAATEQAPCPAGP